MNMHGPSNPAERREQGFVSFKKKKFIEACINSDNGASEEAPLLQLSSVFRGVQVYFQGFLEKYSDYHLKKLVASHGGKVRSYFAVKKVTHLVCSNLSCSKLQDMMERNGNSKITINVVSPKWIVDCVAAKKLVPETRYTILPSDSPLGCFFGKKIINESMESCSTGKRALPEEMRKEIPPNKKQVTLPSTQPKRRFKKSSKEASELLFERFASQHAPAFDKVPDAQSKRKKLKHQNPKK